MQTRILISITMVVACWLMASPDAMAVKEENKDIKEILKSYYFVADFEQKPEERAVSDRLFWKYPFKLPPITFPIEYDFKDIEHEFPKTVGNGRAIQNMARGRKMLLEGEIERAKNTWLTVRSQFGKEFSHHRRNDYFIAYSFLKLAEKELELKKYDYEDPAVKTYFDNATTFFAWAYNAKRDIPDPVVDRNTAKSFYNMAAIYWRYGRYAGAYGAAENGLNYLRKTGETDYRPQFHRITAEAFIKNRTYLDAAQKFDVAIRQDPNAEQAAAIFARVGDIYFDLNNYELASDAYRYGSLIDEELMQVNPAQLILRGESKFWLGEFDEAQRLLDFGIRGTTFRDVVTTLPYKTQAYAALRFADAYLAKGEMDNARLEYYKVAHNYRGTEAARVAAVRDRCLDLPEFGGKNVKHARQDLEKAKTDLLPAPARELAWACQVASYADRERTPDMVARVKTFAGQYPKSRFLKDLVEPVRETQAKLIDNYFSENEPYKAASFFETNRKLLYKEVTPALQGKLFAAYVDMFQPEKAAEFWSQAQTSAKSDFDHIRLAVEAVEMSESTQSPEWQERSARIARDLKARNWSLQPNSKSNRHVSRIMAVDAGKEHLPWIAKLAGSWAHSDERFMCNLKFPAMSKMLANGIADRDALDVQMVSVVESHMPGMLKTDEACALSILDLEIKINQARLGDLGKRYLARNEWPLVGAYGHAFWALSEKVEKAGDKQTAAKMWERLVEKAPANSSIRRFAMARLDKSRTEFEALWDN